MAGRPGQQMYMLQLPIFLKRPLTELIFTIRQEVCPFTVMSVFFYQGRLGQKIQQMLYLLTYPTKSQCPAQKFQSVWKLRKIFERNICNFCCCSLKIRKSLLNWTVLAADVLTCAGIRVQAGLGHICSDYMSSDDIFE